MTTKILKSTERGQITLPKEWRDHFVTNNYFAQISGDKLIITPLNLDTMNTEEVLFDADRDNAGKGVTPDQMITALKKIRHG